MTISMTVSKGKTKVYSLKGQVRGQTNLHVNIKRVKVQYCTVLSLSKRETKLKIHESLEILCQRSE